MNQKKRERIEEDLDEVGWGLLFLAFAALALPNGPTEYAAVVAVGLAMLGLNAVRLALRVPVRWFTTVLGATGFLAGALALAGARVDAFVLFFLLLGVVNIGAASVRLVRRPAAA